MSTPGTTKKKLIRMPRWVAERLEQKARDYGCSENTLHLLALASYFGIRPEEALPLEEPRPQA